MIGGEMETIKVDVNEIESLCDEENSAANEMLDDVNNLKTKFKDEIDEQKTHRFMDGYEHEVNQIIKSLDTLTTDEILDEIENIKNTAEVFEETDEDLAKKGE